MTDEVVTQAVTESVTPDVQHRSRSRASRNTRRRSFESRPWRRRSIPVGNRQRGRGSQVNILSIVSYYRTLPDWTKTQGLLPLSDLLPMRVLLAKLVRRIHSLTLITHGDLNPKLTPSATLRQLPKRSNRLAIHSLSKD